VPRGAARGDHDPVDLEQLFVRDVQPPKARRAFVLKESPAERVVQALGLVHDLLEHEMRVAAAFDRAQIPGHVRHGLFLFYRIDVQYPVLVGPDDRDFAVVQVDHRARVGEHCGRV